MDDDETRIAEILRRLGSRALDRADRADCPTEETLATFKDDVLSEAARERLEAHLAHCSFCSEDILGAFNSAQLDDREAVPQRLVDKALALVSGRESFLDLTVRLLAGSIELVRTTGRLIPAPLPVLRTAATASQGNSLQVEQEVGRFRVAVELDLSEAGICQVIANVRDETGKPVEGVRLSLSSEEREQASFLTRGGLVVFDRISPGEYSIAVSESGNAVGKIRLNLMLER